MDLSHVGKWIVVAGLGFIIVGALLWVAGKMGLPVGRLPGDVNIRHGQFSFHFPLGTCIIVSIVLTLVINFVIRLLSK
ncbi:MAG TPA: DUF2905 domain-containing protein [Candidatus Hydrogenedentes bacterium]|nr:DUF2905 domain-containing protein [Candidatus Hydrogenedentota bacterium]HIJ74927.1 DUF2905 domain-containing protein [Candidatus Hydrogenedentota bacterium]